MNLLRMICISALTLMCLVAFAAEHGFVQTAPLPNRHALNNLDDPQPDTLLYDDGDPQYLWPGNDYWIRVEFTAPDTFELRSIYFYTTNFESVAGPCSIWVHADDEGDLGDVLSVYEQETLLDGGFNDTNLPTPVTFDPGEVFYIVLGPMPGGEQSETWVPMIDGNSTGHGALGTNGHYGDYDPNVPGDWMVRAGGNLVDYTDLQPLECWNIIDSADPAFNFLPDSDVLLYAEIMNSGSEDVEAFSVNWQIDDPNGQTIYTETSNYTSLAVGQTLEAVAPMPITVTTLGEYIAYAEVFTPEDAVFGNNTKPLRFFVGDTPRWFRYDDNEESAETQINPSQGTSWGVSFIPTTYPARVDSVRVFFGGEGEAQISLYLNDPDEGSPLSTPAYVDNPMVTEGWNSIAITPPFDIFDGQIVTVATEWTTDAVATGKDDDAPNQAGITNMPGVAWQGFQGTWTPDLGGNWCIQAYLDTSSAIPPYPVIEVSVEELDFGTVPVNQTAELSFWIWNRGDIDDLVINDVNLLPPVVRNIYSLNPETPTIAAHDSVEVVVTFAPENAGQAYNGLMDLINNSENNSNYQIVLRGTGGEIDAAGDNRTGLPERIALSQNYPNPFNPSTSVEFALPARSDVRLTVFNTLGQEVASLARGSFDAGYHAVEFDAAALSAGLYFYKLEAGSFTQTRKMMLLK